ncbi:Hypothetical predicted protein [Paramuricea clavata]|uniref:Uncharacterized protein n=1 Tax=Paramuricea clavata TaxID=317549 RepID=A0A6S7FT87_PARCT|nr:Hypothetical predicted protein [Paramuricea clavata]
MAVNMSDASTDVSTCYSTNDCLSNLKTLQIDYSNGKDIIIDENKKLKWKESYEALKVFVKKTLKLNGKWSSPGGNLKLFNETTGSIILRYYTNSASLLIQGEKGESFTNILIKKLSTMHPNSGTNIIADDNSCEPEKSEESQNMYDVSISEQSQDIFTFDQRILTGTIKQKNNEHVSHTDEVNYIIDHSQTPNMEPQTLHKNQEIMTENCSQTMPQTDTANSSNADLLKYVCRLR